MIYKAEFELEAITPIFMRGADQTKAEIRSASIKGLMRWWFRALAGNYFGDDIEKLKRAEESVFGSTNQRSKVVVEIPMIDSEKSMVLFKRGVVDRRSPTNQLRYLWFSINLLAKKDQFDEYYPAETKFRVKIKAFDEKSFKIALASFWALVTLGGIGFRSRRGAGSLRFYGGDLEVFKELNLMTEFNTFYDLKNSIEQVIELIGECLNKSKLSVNDVKYPVLSKDTSVVAIWNPKESNPINALRNFEIEYLKYRKNNRVKKDRIVFGLPINLRGKNTYDIRQYLSKLRDTRRASPMLVGVIYINGKTYIRIVKFKTKIYHPDTDIDSLANWRKLKDFNKNDLGDSIIFGNLEVFR